MDRRGRRPADLDLERGVNQEEGAFTPRRSARLAGTPLQNVHTLPGDRRARVDPGTPQPSGEHPRGQFTTNPATPVPFAPSPRRPPSEVEAESVPPPPSPSSSGSSNVTSIRESNEDEECPICRETITGNIKTCRQCNKDFHAECINRWEAQQRHTCPNCRGQTGYISRRLSQSPDRMSVDTELPEITGSRPVNRGPRRQPASQWPNRPGGGPRQIPVAPQVVRPEDFQNSSSEPTAPVQDIRPGFASSGQRIRAVRGNTRAVVEESDGRLTYLTAVEAGGTEVLQRASVLPSVKQIETGGWKELKARWASITNPRINWVVAGSWDPYKQRLPEIVACLCYEENGQLLEKIGARSNINILFGSAVGDSMLAHGLCPGSIKPQDALERLCGVTHRERVDYWLEHPRVPRG
ncbi:hypothetical protein BJX63DRAFT_25085 [Aspergillus granulosus]|uniref:RING-type domain-containing protein n=1 Tax=Aspergillus granulosus TaxID=176169 RepID=A0ABR4GZR4_9EURO